MNFRFIHQVWQLSKKGNACFELFKSKDDSNVYLIKSSKIKQSTECIKRLCTRIASINSNFILFYTVDNQVTKVYFNNKSYSLNPTIPYDTEQQKQDLLSINAIIKKIEEYTPPPPVKGGAKTNNKKKTKDTIVYKGKSRCIYIGPRGGKYIKCNNKYMSCKNVV